MYDSSPSSLNNVRAELTVGEDKLYSGPYLIGTQDDEWGKAHLWDDIYALSNELLKSDDGKRALPNSLVHDLRHAAFLGKDAAQKTYDLAKSRCNGLVKAIGEDLFISDGKNHICRLHDAIEISQLKPIGGANGKKD